MFAVNRENGEHRWRADAKDFTIARAVRDGRLFVTSLDGWLAEFDAKTGERLWQKESENDSAGGTDYESVVITPTALLVRERVRSAYPDRVRAFDPKMGDVLWTLSPDEGGPLLDRFWYTGPVAASDDAFVCENWRDGESSLHRLDVETGEKRETVLLASYALTTPVVSRGVLVVGCDDELVAYSDET